MSGLPNGTSLDRAMDPVEPRNAQATPRPALRALPPPTTRLSADAALQGHHLAQGALRVTSSPTLVPGQGDERWVEELALAREMARSDRAARRSSPVPEPLRVVEERLEPEITADAAEPVTVAAEVQLGDESAFFDDGPLDEDLEDEVEAWSMVPAPLRVRGPGSSAIPMVFAAAVVLGFLVTVGIAGAATLASWSGEIAPVAEAPAARIASTPDVPAPSPVEIAAPAVAPPAPASTIASSAPGPAIASPATPPKVAPKAAVVAPAPAVVVPEAPGSLTEAPLAMAVEAPAPKARTSEQRPKPRPLTSGPRTRPVGVPASPGIQARPSEAEGTSKEWVQWGEAKPEGSPADPWSDPGSVWGPR